MKKEKVNEVAKDVSSAARKEIEAKIKKYEKTDPTEAAGLKALLGE